MRYLLGMALCAVLGCSSSSTSSTSNTPTSSVPDDKQALQGKWLLVELVRDGRDQGKISDTVLQFDGDIMSDVVPKGGSEKFRIILDAAKSPKEIDFAELNAKGEVKKFPLGSGPKDMREVDAIFKGIYELNGDTLRISVAMRSPDDQRPRSMDADVRDVHRMKLERVK